jgi:energy-coupling factor transport system ATP-binding protein
MQNSQALLPQNPKALFVCDSVLEELSEWQSSCCYAAEDINNILSLFGLNPYKNQHPYDLSGGQQQLLALAKLLLTNPSLLLLDEPTKGLDAAAKSTIAQALRHAASTGTTILFATHDLAFAKYVAHNTSMLFDGEIVCTEPSELFFENNLFYRPAFDEFSKCYQKTQSPSNANPQTQTAPKEKSLLL